MYRNSNIEFEIFFNYDTMIKTRRIYGGVIITYKLPVFQIKSNLIMVLRFISTYHSASASLVPTAGRGRRLPHNIAHHPIIMYLFYY